MMPLKQGKILVPLAMYRIYKTLKMCFCWACSCEVSKNCSDAMNSRRFVFEQAIWIVQHTVKSSHTHFEFNARFLKKAGSAKAGFAAGYYEVAEFFSCVEFKRQPG